MALRTLAFLAGVVAFAHLARLPVTGEWLFLTGTACLLGIVAHFLDDTVGRGARLALFLLAGFAWAGWRAVTPVAEALPAGLEGVDLDVVGAIADLPVVGEGRTRFDLVPESMTRDGVPVPFRATVRLNWYEGAPPLHAGERWRLAVRLKRPHGMANPGGFDYEAHLFETGIRAVGYVRAGESNQRLSEAAWWSVDGWRDRVRQRLQRALEGTPRGGILVALAIGDGSGIDSEEWDLFRATGTTHLMAISGLHVGMVGLLAAWAVRRLWRTPALIHRLPAQKAAALAGVVAALIYGAIAGFSVPTQRTVITLVAVVAALFSARVTRPATLLAVACWAVLVWDPLSVLAPGFWLSFGAVALILFGTGARLAAEGLWWRFGRIHWVLWLGLTPLLVAFFGNASLVSPLANLVAVPWVSLGVVPLTLAGTLLLFVWEGAGQAVLHLAGWLVAWLWPVLDHLARWVPPLSLPQPPGWILVGSLFGMALWLAPRGWPGRGLGLLWCLPIFLWLPERPAAGEVWLTVLDVGQGLAAVVETRERVLVFDAGPSLGPDFDAGEAAVAPFLRARGWSRLDTLLISHGDDDHAGGARSLLSALPVGRVLAAVPNEGFASEPCHRGVAWEWNGVRFRVLHPALPEADNDGSCVLRVEGRGGTLLLTGDIEGPAEEALVGSGEPLSARVLVVPHHGSRSSSTEPFIDAVAPEVALLSTGYRNRFHLPNAGVVARYEARHIRLADTARAGAITLRLAVDGSLAVTGYRSEARHYWQAEESLGGTGPLW